VNDVIFYFGNIIIIALFVWLLILRFKDVDNIDLSRHIWIIILYTILLVLSIITWRIIYLIIISNIKGINNYNIVIESTLNG